MPAMPFQEEKSKLAGRFNEHLKLTFLLSTKILFIVNLGITS
jgi:hypothetical protein